jgi:hypothetical protein
VKNAERWVIEGWDAEFNNRARRDLHQVNLLEPPDILYLQAAEGWVELGRHLEAAAES